MPVFYQKLRQCVAFASLFAFGALHAPPTAAAAGFQGSEGDDVVRVSGAANAPAGSVLDGRGGFDTLFLQDVAPRQLVEQGARLLNFERVWASYESAASRDDLRIRAKTFRYDYYADTSSRDYRLEIAVLDERGSAVAKLEFEARKVGTSDESISIRVAQGAKEGVLIALAGAINTDTLSTDARLTALLDWSTHDPGYLSPLPPPDAQPAILACLVAGPAAPACLIGSVIVIAIFCCETPDGHTGA